MNGEGCRGVGGVDAIGGEAVEYEPLAGEKR